LEIRKNNKNIVLVVQVSTIFLLLDIHIDLLAVNQISDEEDAIHILDLYKMHILS